MGFKIFMIVCELIIPAVMLIFGAIFAKKAPENINYIYGYRTELSMKNQDTWQFAHRHCGRVWIRVGTVLMAASILAMALILTLMGETAQGIAYIILVAAQLVCLLLSIMPTQRALKRTFDRDGNRRQL